MDLKEIPIYKSEQYPIDSDVKLVATAGAGKTTQILLRAIGGIEKYALDPDQYTFATYRTELADELYTELQNNGYISETTPRSQTYIGTIHGVCKRLLDNHDILPDKYDFVAESHKNEFCNQYNIGYKDTKYEKSEGEKAFDTLTYYQNTQQDTEESEHTITCSDRTEISLHEFAVKWEAFKNSYEPQLFDFDELVTLVEEHNLTPPNRYLVIDEMHDVYPLLHQTIKRWVTETKHHDKKTVIVAGDPRQVINTHQGTKPDYFLNTELPEVTIPKTYRCPQNVWEYAQSILDEELDHTRIDANKNDGTVTEVKRVNFTKKSGYWTIVGDEYEYYPQNIYTNRDDYTLEQDVMFLVRSRHQIPAITTQLDSEGIIYDGQHENSWTQKDDLLDIYNALQKIQLGYEMITQDELMALYRNLSTDAQQYITPIPEDKNEYAIDVVIAPEFINMKRYKYKSQLKIPSEDISRLDKALINYSQPIEPDEITCQVRTIHESKGMQAETVVLLDGITDRIKNNITSDSVSRKTECRTWFVGASRSSEELIILQDTFSSMSPTPFL